MKSPVCRLYLVTPPTFETATFADTLASALDAGDVAAVQLRLKGADDDAIRAAADALLPVCRARAVPLIMNDRPDLAAAAGCDGVHIGQDDAPYGEARRAVGDDGIVGVTCHASRHLGMEAAELGANYVAFGAFFPTATKTPKSEAAIDIVEWWNDIMVVPQVAIGGITAANCRPLVQAGADFVAVVSAVWDHIDGPAAGIGALNAAIAEAATGGVVSAPPT